MTGDPVTMREFRALFLQNLDLIVAVGAQVCRHYHEAWFSVVPVQFHQTLAMWQLCLWIKMMAVGRHHPTIPTTSSYNHEITAAAAPSQDGSGGTKRKQLRWRE
jgi:hypothetical protein